MDNILETDLRLTHAPISIKDFNRIKKAIALDSVLWHEKESPIMLHSISQANEKFQFSFHEEKYQMNRA